MLCSAGVATALLIALNMKKIPLLPMLFLLLLGIAGVFFGAPFFTLYSIDKALDGSPERLEKHVDFPRLRENLERRLEVYVLEKWNRNAAQRQVETLVAGRVSKIVIERAVERYITPEGLIELAGKKDSSPLAFLTDEVLGQLSQRQGRLHAWAEKLGIPEDLRMRSLDQLRALQERFLGKEEPPPAPAARSKEPFDPAQVKFDFEFPDRVAAVIPAGSGDTLTLLLYRYNLVQWRLADIILPLP